MQRINFKNAVLYKDMMVRAKRSNMSILMFILNLLLSIVAVIIVLSLNLSLSSFQSPSGAILPWFFISVIIFESAMICLVVPPASAGSISGEREHQTLDVLLTTNMTPLEIILGKYFSCLIYIGLLLLSTLPMVSIVFIYGSISFIQILALYGTLAIVAMYLASFGIYFSTICKKSSTATILSYLAIWVLIFGTISITAIGSVIVMIRNDAMNYEIYTLHTARAWSRDPFFFLLYLNPAATVVDVVGRLIGFDFGSDVFGGMDYILYNLGDNIQKTNFFIKFWTPISIILQLAVTFSVLTAAARILDPTTHKKAKSSGR